MPLRPITDPALLKELGGPPKFKPITDPALLEELGGPPEEAVTPAPKEAPVPYPATEDKPLVRPGEQTAAELAEAQALRRKEEGIPAISPPSAAIPAAPVQSDDLTRPDGTRKGPGWLGTVNLPDGGVASEYSVQSDAVKVDGKRIDFPTIVPTLTKDELEALRTDIIPNRREIPEPIMQKAIEHAKEQIAKGENVFAAGEFATPPVAGPDLPKLRHEAFTMLNDAGRMSPIAQRNLADASGGAAGGFARAGRNVAGALGEVIANPSASRARTGRPLGAAPPSKAAGEAEALDTIGDYDDLREMLKDRYGDKADEMARNRRRGAVRGTEEPPRTQVDTLVDFIKYYEENGVTDGKQMMTLLKDSIREYNWDKSTDDDTRTLSDGSLRLNPRFAALPDAQKGLAAIRNSGASEEQKALAERVFLNSRKLTAAAMDEKARGYDKSYREYAEAKNAAGVTDSEKVFYGWPGLDRNWIQNSWDVVRDTVAQAGRDTYNSLVRGPALGLAKATGDDEDAARIGRDIIASGEKAQYVREIAAARGQEGPIVGTGKELATTVLDMYPMFRGAKIGRNIGGRTGKAFSAVSVYGYAGLQGYASVMQTALMQAQAEADRLNHELTDEEINAAVDKAQGPALLNGLQTTVLARTLRQGAEAAALKGFGAKAGQMTGRDVVAALKKNHGAGWKDAIRRTAPEIRAFAAQTYKAAGVGFTDEALEEYGNQYLEGMIGLLSGIEADLTMDEIGQRSAKGGGFGAVIGTGLPIAVKTFAKSDPAMVKARQMIAEAQVEAPDVAAEAVKDVKLAEAAEAAPKPGDPDYVWPAPPAAPDAPVEEAAEEGQPVTPVQVTLQKADAGEDITSREFFEAIEGSIPGSPRHEELIAALKTRGYERAATGDGWVKTNLSDESLPSEAPAPAPQPAPADAPAPESGATVEQESAPEVAAEESAQSGGPEPTGSAQEGNSPSPRTDAAPLSADQAARRDEVMQRLPVVERMLGDTSGGPRLGKGDAEMFEKERQSILQELDSLDALPEGYAQQGGVYARTNAPPATPPAPEAPVTPAPADLPLDALPKGTVVRSDVYKSEGDISITGPVREGPMGPEYPAHFDKTKRTGTIQARHIDKVVGMAQPLSTPATPPDGARGEPGTGQVPAVGSAETTASVSHETEAGAGVEIPDAVTLAATPYKEVRALAKDLGAEYDDYRSKKRALAFVEGKRETLGDAGGKSRRIGATTNRKKEIFEADATVGAVKRAGGILSKTQAKKKWSKEKFGANKSQWDGAPSGGDPTFSSIYSEKGLTPNLAAEEAGHGDVEAMWEAIGKARKAATAIGKGQAAEDKKLAAKEEQTVAFEEAAGTKNEGDTEVNASDLEQGDMLTLDGETFRVTEVEYDRVGDVQSVTLRDGQKFGQQQIGGGESLSVEQVTKGEQEGFLPPGAAEPDTPMARRNADTKELFEDDGGFRLTGEQTQDGAAVEKARIAKAKAEEAQAKQQGDMFGEAAQPAAPGPAEEGAPPAEPPVEPPIEPPATPEPPAPPVETPTEEPGYTPPETTSTKNAETDKELEAAGFEPIAGPASEALQENWDAALAVTAKDPNAGSVLVDELIAKPRVASDLEHGILLDELAKRKLRLNRAAKDIKKGNATARAKAKALGRKKISKEDEKAHAKLREAYDAASISLYDAVRAAKLTGTEWGRAGRFRQVKIDQDYSFAAIESRIRTTINKGEPLTDEQIDLVQEASDALKQKKEGVLDWVEDINKTKDQAEAEREAALFDVIDELTEQVEALKEKAAKRSNSVMARMRKAMAKPSDEARARLKALGLPTAKGPEPGTEAALSGPTPEMVKNMAQIVADYATLTANWLVGKGSTLSDFAGRMATEFGDWTRQIAPQVFARARQIDAEVEAAMSSSEAATPQQILDGIDPDKGPTRAEVKALALNYIIKGENGRNVLDKVLADLAGEGHELTRDELAIKLTNYGTVTRPTTQEHKQELERIITMERLQQQIRDLEAGRSPRKTGPQQLETDERIRDLQKRVRELQRKSGIEPENDEDFLKSPLGAMKRRMLNEIAELEAALNATPPTPKSVEVKTPIEEDQEARDIRARLKKVRADYDAVFAKGKTKRTMKQRQEVATRLLKNRIAEVKDMISKGTFKRTVGKPVTDTAEMKALRDELAPLEEQLRALDPGTDPMVAAKKEADAAIERYREMLKTGEVAVKQGKKINPDDELKALWAMRDALAAEVREARKRLPGTKGREREQIKRALEASKRTLARVQDKLAKGDLSVAPRKETAASKDAAVRRVREQVKLANRELARRRRALIPKKDPMKVRVERNLKSLAKRKIEAVRRIRDRDYSKKAKLPPITDERVIKQRKELDKINRELNAQMLKDAWDKQHLAKKALILGLDALFVLPRAAKTSIDIGTAGRQQLNALQARPKLIRHLTANLTFTVKQAERAEAVMEGDPLFDLLKPYFSYTNWRQDTPEKEQDELFRSIIAKHLPGIAQSERSYITGLNKTRFEYMKILHEVLKGKVGGLTKENLTAAGLFVDQMTGRGQLKVGPVDLERHAELFAKLLFSPKNWVSRLQVLGGVGYSLADSITGFHLGTKETRLIRKVIAAERARMAMGQAAMYGLIATAMWLRNMGKDDDDKWKIGTDRLSTDFGKVISPRGTRIDPGAGLLQNAVFASQFIAGERTSAVTGKRLIFTGDEKNTQGNRGTAVMRMLRMKTAPVPGAVWNWLVENEDVIGQPTLPESDLMALYIPISVNDSVEAYQQLGLAQGTAASLLNFAGFGTSTYGEGVENPTAIQEAALKKVIEPFATGVLGVDPARYDEFRD